MSDTRDPHLKRFRYKNLVRAVSWVLILFVLLAAGAFLAFNYFGRQVIEQYLQNRISRQSLGVYGVRFSGFTYNLFSGKATISKFALIPDEKRYLELLADGKVKKTLYEFSYDKLTLHRLHLKELFFDRVIHLNLIELDKPEIRFVAFPDSVTRKRGRFHSVYEDIYPLLSSVFREVRVDSILVTDGSFSGKQTGVTGVVSEGDWLYSAILRDFDLRSYERDDPDRVFYSKDVELRIKNFRYSLADSLYLLRAEEVGFSINDRRLFGKEIILTPDFAAPAATLNRSGNLYQIHLPDFSFSGIDLLRALVEQEIHIQNLDIDRLSVNVFRHRPESIGIQRNPGSRVTMASLYSIIEGKLASLSIDTFLLDKAHFRYFSSLTDPRPELSVNQASLAITGFRLDSLAHLDTTKILYSNDIEFDLQGFTLAMQDKLHTLQARQITMSTSKDAIGIMDARLNPVIFPGHNDSFKSPVLYRMLIPEIRVDQINIRRMFNTKNLAFDRLSFREPEITVIQYREGHSAGNTLGEREETFIQKLDLSKHLLAPYLHRITGGEIEVSNAQISFRQQANGQIGTRISGLADVKINGLDMSMMSDFSQKQPLGKLELDLSLYDFKYTSPDTLHKVSINRLFANTRSTEVEVYGFGFSTASSRDWDTPGTSRLDLTVDTLLADGFDYRRWRDSREFLANSIRISAPQAKIRSFRRKQASTLSDPFSGVEERISRIAVNRFSISEGSLELEEVETNRKGSLTIPPADLQLNGFDFDLSGWEQGKRSLRYDLLTLHPRSGKPVILDSLYYLTFSRFLSSDYPPDFMISDLRITTSSSGETDKDDKAGLEVRLPSVVIRALNLERLVFHRQVEVGQIKLGDPSVSIAVVQKPRAGATSHTPILAVHPELKGPFTSLQAGQFELVNGRFSLMHRGDSPGRNLEISDIRLEIDGFRYDSIVAGQDDGPVFYSRDIRFSCGRWSTVTSDSLYTFSLEGISLSTLGQSLRIDSLSLIPNFPPETFGKRVGHQTDRITLTVPEIEVLRIRFRELLEQQTLFAGRVNLRGITFDDYRDKRLEFPYWRRPPMPQQGIRKLSRPVTIDTIDITGARMTYSEQTGEQPGVIWLDRINLLIRNFTSDTAFISHGAVLEATGSAYLMGQAPLEGYFRFPLRSPVDTFQFHGSSGRVDMTLINPMLSEETPVRIRSGIVDSLKVHWMRGNDSITRGFLDVYYHGLQIDLQHKKQDFWNKAGTDLMQLLVNLILAQRNEYPNKHRSGYISNVRNQEKGYMNFFWKSVLSGLKSGEGFNSEEQRKLKQELRQHQKR